MYHYSINASLIIRWILIIFYVITSSPDLGTWQACNLNLQELSIETLIQSLNNWNVPDMNLPPAKGN